MVIILKGTRAWLEFHEGDRIRLTGFPKPMPRLARGIVFSIEGARPKPLVIYNLLLKLAGIPMRQQPKIGRQHLWIGVSSQPVQHPLFRNSQLHEIGRMIGGWQKDVERKQPPS